MVDWSLLMAAGTISLRRPAFLHFREPFLVYGMARGGSRAPDPKRGNTQYGSQ
jgi:hypothetical protein